MSKYFFSLLIIVSVFLALPARAEVVTNSGFIPGQIWYSSDALIEGDTVNIYTAVWNGEKNSLSTKVEFYDKNVILGNRDIILAPLELKKVFVPWKITSGDHVISAKIISSLSTIAGKKEKVALGRILTSSDRQFVAVVAKNNQDEPVKISTELKNQINKTSSEINNIFPEKVSSSISNGFAVVDNFRDKTFKQISTTKNETQKEINSNPNFVKTSAETVEVKSSVEDATKKPIAYIKLFIFSILFFIFGNKIIFYAILILVAFYIIRSIYRKIQNR